MKKILDGIYQLLGYGYNCNTYLIKSGNSGLLIDSGLGKYGQHWGDSGNFPLDELKNTIKIENIAEIVFTHAHLDHTGGVSSLTPEERSELKILAHKDESKYLETALSRYIDPIFSTKTEKIIIDKNLSNGEKIKIGDITLEVIHTAGHTEGSICLYEPDKKILFSGDTVFPEGYFGRVDFYGSNPEDMIQSLDTLRNLQVNTLLAGHGEPVLFDVQSSLEQSYKNAKYLI